MTLLPCPFCGSDAEFFKIPEKWGYSPEEIGVKCSKCWVITPSKDTSKWEPGRGTYSIKDKVTLEVSAMWNKRV